MPRGVACRLRWAPLAVLAFLGTIWNGSAAVRTVSAASTEATGGATAEAGEPWIDATDRPRLYVSGLAGSSLSGRGGGNAAGIPGRGLLAGGMPEHEAALGVAIPRPGGAVRLEFEARGGDEWSTMANAWRELSVTERFGAYVGGGLGVSGHTDAATGTNPSPDGHLGAGVTCAVNERITLDAGYRLHAGRLAAARDEAPRGSPLDAGAAALAGGEILFSVRIYDPFRGWLR